MAKAVAFLCFGAESMERCVEPGMCYGEICPIVHLCDKRPHLGRKGRKAAQKVRRDYRRDLDALWASDEFKEMMAQ